MKTTVDRKALLKLVSKVKPAVATGRVTLPITQNILLEVTNNRVIATGTNLEVALIASCDTTPTETGAIAIPAKALESFLKAVTADKLTLEYTEPTDPKLDPKLKIVAGNSKVTLDCKLAEDFPVFKLPSECDSVIIEDLAGALHQVEYAVERDGYRPVLNTVSFKPMPDSHIELCATDSFRLASVLIDCQGTLIKQILVPIAAIALLSKLESVVSLNIDSDTDSPSRIISFVTDDVTLVTNSVQGTYPDYSQLIPTTGSIIKTNADDFKKALKTIVALNTGSGILRLEAKNGLLRLSGRDEGTGEIAVEIAASGECRVGLNIKYVKDMLDRFSGDIEILTSQTSPNVVRQGNSTHLIMPMFVKWEE